MQIGSYQWKMQRRKLKRGDATTMILGRTAH